MAASSESNLCIVVCFMFALLNGCIVAANDDYGSSLKVVNIGVFFESSSRIGKEQRVGMEIAAEDFNYNSSSNGVRVKLHFHNSSSSNSPLQAAYSATKLVKEKKIETMITGTDLLDERALLEEIGTQYKVPILSLSAASISPPLVKGESFLVQMNTNYTAQIRCVASLVKIFGWKKVIAVYENDDYGGSSISSMLDVFSEALQEVGSQIEYRLALPSLAIASNPKEMIIEELMKVFNLQSRVFVLLHSSLPMAIQLFKEANNLGLVGRETAWITTSTIADLYDALNSSTKSYIEGTLGVKTYYDENSQAFNDFRRKFISRFVKQAPDEHSFYPGIHALRAYDAITTIGRSFARISKNKSNSPEVLLREISSNKFTGFSGEINIVEGSLQEEDKLYTVVNVVGKSYKELNYWSSNSGFFEKLSDDAKVENSSENSNKMINGMVNWPGDMKHVPKGWTMPITVKPLKIGIPGQPVFDKFIVVKSVGSENKTTYSGFCIDVFLEAVKIIEESYSFPYEFDVYNGTYDELVDRVHDKTYDIVVGDVTILANRSKFVEFTQPYTKSGLSMIVPLKSKESQKDLMFIKPFTWQLWLVTLCTLLYTMLIVWWIESQNTNNSDFEGCWRNQLNSALWFTFSSLFFAQKESIKSNLTRLTVIVWLFVVFVLTSSYTASLTSMLTVPLLEPSKVKDVEWLIKTNARIGCDGGSVWDHLVNVLGFRPENIMNVSSQYDYQDLFANSTIIAAFIERPYQKLLVNQYCKSFTQTKETFGFGAQGFVFQKGSPLVGDVSNAILKISENGVIKELQDKWFPIASECTASANDHEVERLNPRAFVVLYAIYGTISTFCFLFFVVTQIRRFNATGITRVDTTFFNWFMMLTQYIHGQHNRNSQISRSDEFRTARETNDDWVVTTLELPTYHSSL